MRRSTAVIYIFFISLGYVVLTGSSFGRASFANFGNTGAPGESQLCENCHHSATSYGTVSIAIEVFEQGTETAIESYVPDQIYDVRVTVNHSAGNPAGYGFQLTSLTVADNIPLQGYSSLSSNVKQITLTSGFFSGRTYVEHNGVGALNEFNFSWTAPAVGTGDVKFYAAGNAVNGNEGSSGDRSGYSSLMIQEFIPIEVPEAEAADQRMIIAPNPAIHTLRIQSKEVVNEVRIYTVSGLLQMTATPYSNEFTLDISNLSPGMYYMNTTCGSKSEGHRILKIE